MPKWTSSINDCKRSSESTHFVACIPRYKYWKRDHMKKRGGRESRKKTRKGQNMRAVNNTLREIILRKRPLTVTNNWFLFLPFSPHLANIKLPLFVFTCFSIGQGDYFSSVYSFLRTNVYPKVHQLCRGIWTEGGIIFVLNI